MTTVYERCTEWGMTPHSQINELERQVQVLTEENADLRQQQAEASQLLREQQAIIKQQETEIRLLMGDFSVLPTSTHRKQKRTLEPK